jgi:CRP-like cAMP-binding protein
MHDAALAGIERRHLPRGASVSREGEVSTAVKVLRSGTLLVNRRGLDDRQRPIGMVHPGTAVCLGSLMGVPNQTSTVAASPVETCEVAAVRLRPYAADPRLQCPLRADLVRASHEITHWSQAVRLRGSRARAAYSLLLLNHMQGGKGRVQLPSFTAWAALLSMRREALVRALGQLVDEGAVHTAGRREYVVDVPALEALLQPAAPAR